MPLVSSSCALTLDFAKFTGGEGVDAGPRDAGDGGDAALPDGCTLAPETCNGADDDCDGTIDEEPTECSVTHGVVECIAGACGLSMCDSGFADCDGDSSTCEAETRVDHGNCGGCTTPCGPVQSCNGGTCTNILEGWAIYLTGMSAVDYRAEALAAVTDGVIGAGQIFGSTNRLESIGLTPDPPSPQFWGPVYRLSSTGSIAWVKLIRNPSVGIEAIATDVTDNAYVVGVSSDAEDVIYDGSVLRNRTDGAGFIVAVDSAGSFRWGHHYGLVGRALDVAVGMDQDIWVVGQYQGELRVDGNAFPSETHPRGNFVVRQRSNAAIVFAVGFAEDDLPAQFVAVDAAGNSYLYGHSPDDFRVRSLGPDGAVRWNAVFACPGGFTGSKGIAVSNGVVMIAGSCSGDVSIGSDLVAPPFVAGLDAGTGNPLWNRANQSATPTERIAGLADGFLRVGTTGIDPVSFGFGDLPRPGGRDAFVEVLGISGAHRYGYLVGSNGSDQGTSAAMSRDESTLYVGGSASATMMFGGMSHINSTGGGDAFVAQLTR